MLFLVFFLLLCSICFCSVRLILLHGEPQPASSTGSLPSMCTKLGAQCDKNFLDLVFSSLILMLSVDALTSNANVERLKKDLKVCFSLAT